MKVKDRLEALLWLWVLGIVIMAEFALSAIAFPFLLLGKLFEWASEKV